MPVLHAVAALLLGAVAATLAARLLTREWQRVNADLDRARKVPVNDRERAGLPVLQRDPKTGEYRPQR
jgi:hypothetical protein